MKEIIDKHFNAVSLIIAIGAIIISFYATNQSINSRIDAVNARTDAFYAALTLNAEQSRQDAKDFHNRLIEIEMKSKKY